MKAQVNPKSTSNQSSKPCTVLQYPSKKQYFGYSDNDPLRCRLPCPPQQRSMCLCHEPHHAHIQDTKTSREGIAKIFCTDCFFEMVSLSTCALTHPYVWHDSFTCVTCRICMCQYLWVPVPSPRLPSQVMWACARIRYARTQYTLDLRRRNRAIWQRYRAGMPFPRGWIAKWPLTYGRAGACHTYEGVTSHTQMSHVAQLPTNCKVALKMRARWSSKGLCVITHPCVWRDSFVCIQMSIARWPWLCGCAGAYIRHWVTSHMNSSHVWHDSLLCNHRGFVITYEWVLWLHMSESCHTCELIHMWRDSLICNHKSPVNPYKWVMSHVWAHSYVTWLTHM